MKVKALFKQNETPTVIEYLARCGVASPKNYDNPPASVVESPYKYYNMDKGIEVLEEAIADVTEHNKSIVLICDCDCDGYCATTIAHQFLTSCGVPHSRIETLFHKGKQHGLSKEIMERFSLGEDNADKIALLWIPDAGTNDVTACAYLSSYWNIPILITDHHELSKQNDYATIINNQDGGAYNTNLCGAGVTHKLITAYCKEHDSKFYQSVLDLVALATIGDVMDMRSLENRLIVRWGIRHINNPFLRAMCDEFISDGDINPTSLAWNVIPKINAVCRSNDYNLKVELFVALCISTASNDYQDIISKLKNCHRNQSDESKALYEKALKSDYIGDKVKIFTVDNTPYTGLVAMKLSEHYNCPCMVVHESGNMMVGSLRSPCPMRTQLEKSCLMTICAGHEASCGVGWWKEDTDELSAYCKHLDLQPATKQVMYSADNVLIQPEIFDIVEAGKEYWGTGIPEPTIHISNVTINGQDIKEIGANKTTIKFLYGDVTFIMFFASKEVKENLNVGKPVPMKLEIIGTPTINRWRDKESKQIVIQEWEIK